MDPDWDDPCAVLAWLQPIYYKVLAGKQTVMIGHDGSQVSYNQTNARSLAALMRDLQSQCNKANGLTGRRAFTAG